MDLDHLFRKRDKQLFCYIVHLERTQYQWKTVPYIVPQHINYLHLKFGYFSGIGYGYTKRFSVLLLSHFPDDNGYFDASAQFHVWFCKVHNHIQLLFDHVASISIEVICVFFTYSSFNHVIRRTEKITVVLLWKDRKDTITRFLPPFLSKISFFTSLPINHKQNLQSNSHFVQ